MHLLWKPFVRQERTSENSILKLSEKSQRGLQLALQAVEKRLFGPFRAPCTGQIHARSVARTPFRTVSLGTWVNKGLLACLLALRSRIGAQPQRDVCRLHRLLYRSYQIVAQRVEVRLIPKLGREGF